MVSPLRAGEFSLRFKFSCLPIRLDYILSLQKSFYFHNFFCKCVTTLSCFSRICMLLV